MMSQTQKVELDVSEAPKVVSTSAAFCVCSNELDSAGGTGKLISMIDNKTSDRHKAGNVQSMRRFGAR